MSETVPSETTTGRLVCPKCKSENLATVEDLSGSAYGRAYVVLDAEGNEVERGFDHEGWTEVWWDSSESKAVECRDCDWSQKAAHDGPDYDELLLGGESDRS